MAGQATPRSTRRPRGWIASVLPEVVDDPGERGERRDRVVDAIMYLVAFTIGFATLVDTWELHPPWLRPVAIVFGIAGIVALHWRRSHPAAVGIFTSAVSLGVATWPSSPASRSSRASRTRCSTAGPRASDSRSGPASGSPAPRSAGVCSYAPGGSSCDR